MEQTDLIFTYNFGTKRFCLKRLFNKNWSEVSIATRKAMKTSSPVYTTVPEVLQHSECLMPDIPPLCSGKPGKRWACWPCCAHLVGVLRGWPWQKGWWRGQLSLLQPSTLIEPGFGYLSAPEIQDRQPGYNWNHWQERNTLQMDKENRFLKGPFGAPHNIPKYQQPK